MDKDNNNIGYVSIGDIREYIKLRSTDPEELWPTHPENFKEIFDNFNEIYSKFAFATFEALASSIDLEDGLPLIALDDYTEIKKFLAEKSSISMIKYNALEKECEVCDEHTDTGILTFITRTNRPGLEIWDKHENKYLKIEEFLEMGDILVFLSEKTPLFSGSRKFLATPHRVRLPEGPQRMSIAYLLDVAK